MNFESNDVRHDELGEEIYIVENIWCEFQLLVTKFRLPFLFIDLRPMIILLQVKSATWIVLSKCLVSFCYLVNCEHRKESNQTGNGFWNQTSSGRSKTSHSYLIYCTDEILILMIR